MGSLIIQFELLGSLIIQFQKRTWAITNFNQSIGEDNGTGNTQYAAAETMVTTASDAATKSEIEESHSNDPEFEMNMTYLTILL